MILIIGFITNQTKAQQDPQFTQFMNNKLFYNPGFAGSTAGKICVNGTFRTQWVGYGGGTAFTNDASGVTPGTKVERGSAPLSQNFGIHGNIGRFGIGLNIWQDQLGFTSTIAPTFSLAYIHPFDNGAKLSGGIGVGIIQNSLDGSKLIANDPTDPKVPKGDVTGLSPNVDFGLYYTLPQLSIFNDFYFGLSSLHLNSPIIQMTKDNYQSNLKAERHYYLMTGATYQQVIPNLDLNPNMIYKTDGIKHNFDFNCLAIYDQKLIGGLTYRTPQEFCVLAGYNFPLGTNSLNLMYSYDLITSDIISYSQGSHEITLKYCFGFKFDPKPPKPFFPIKTPRML
ncbi:MAG: PorP/SprF family type IX secretion system membrane protein [Bacteroidia bacterium]|nr:PorP/SprF family type IX secretion system membrane protein [Bacteroidia bacterium]